MMIFSIDPDEMKLAGKCVYDVEDYGSYIKLYLQIRIAIVNLNNFSNQLNSKYYGH